MLVSQHVIKKQYASAGQQLQGFMIWNHRENPKWHAVIVWAPVCLRGFLKAKSPFHFNRIMLSDVGLHKSPTS